MFSICIWYDRKLGDTGEWRERREEKNHLPDKLYCAAVIHKPHTATQSICPSLTCSHAHSATHTKLRTKAGNRFFSRSQNPVRDTIPGLNWLCFRNCARLGEHRYLFAQSLQDVLACRTTMQRLVHYPEEPAMTGHLRLDSVIAESLRHNETRRQSRKGVRKRRWVQRVLCAATAHTTNVIHEKTQNHWEQGQRGKGWKSSTDVCLCVRHGRCICEQQQGDVGEKCSLASLMWQLFEAHWGKAAGLNVSSSVLHTWFPHLSVLLHLVWSSSSYLKWLGGGEEVIRSDRWQWVRQRGTG